MSFQHFAHRPPSVGIHLLTDPLPHRSISISAEEQPLVSSKRRTRQIKRKKSGLRL
jgi:hypothetical protein